MQMNIYKMCVRSDVTLQCLNIHKKIFYNNMHRYIYTMFKGYIAIYGYIANNKPNTYDITNILWHPPKS